ncbi:lysophospholipid acyltransferase family protein [Alkalibacterium olivapovliticus]|uniref:1-acyl-sn-glycerol-3-phosphate acyltransferase n=1 Tax=Alkalibacterium olivapovliticus TaxID=99907 RepID=A0A2T0WBN1_9LACT|nr:1-acyl-sn-glycerol-3-phosphate acyltransferase [Alkalibacterium olivapovliticus]PRY84111.1 1-acyl-sn-glycerol-3-phosphate acyltransferase [Alkalibacterium olivapovliticus]
MFFTFIRIVVRVLVYILNGKPDVQGKENLPKNDNYILIAPHRSWIDPVFLVLAASPKQFSFMAKQELFKNPLFKWLITKMNAFPVDRHNPGPSAIKTPVKILKETNLGLVIFPTGTRHSQEIKGGAVTIAKMSKKPIVPVVYQGPFTFKALLTRQKASVRFGEPFMVERNVEGIKDVNAYYSDKIQKAFVTLDSEISK